MTEEKIEEKIKDLEQRIEFLQAQIVNLFYLLYMKVNRNDMAG